MSSQSFLLWFSLLMPWGSNGWATNDWPVYRHDVALSGVAPGKGKIMMPEIKWEYYLGPPLVSVTETGSSTPDNLVDLDGDGRPEQFFIQDKTIRVTDLAGHLLWSWIVDGRPLGTARVAKVFPDRKGQQIICFSSRMDTGEGQGYCFSFDKGVGQGQLAWTTGPLSNQYAPMLVIDDVDGDGLPEIINAPHYRVEIFNAQTGALKAQVPEAKGRNYGMLLTRPRRDRPQKDIFVICDFVLHVECVRFENGQWVHAWGHQYLADENAAVPHGRQRLLRVGPNPITDLDGDGKEELLYMLLDASVDDHWHLMIRDTETGTVEADIPAVWLWSVADFDGDGRPELLYTPTVQKKPQTWCDLHLARFQSGKLMDLAAVKDVHPLLMNAKLPASANSIADEGLLDVLRVDINGSGRPGFFYEQKSRSGPFADRFTAASLSKGKIQPRWQFARPGHRLNLVYANTNEVRIRDLSAEEMLTVDGTAQVKTRAALGRPGGFVTMPIAVDLFGDGRNEIVVQKSSGEICALLPGTILNGLPKILWSVPGVAMNKSPAYGWNGQLCPQSADVEGDGRPAILFAAENSQGLGSLVCVDNHGRPKWRRPVPDCPWGGLQAGVDHWTLGRFAGRPRGLDIYLGLHRRGKSSGEGWVLRGDTGSVIWQQNGLVARETAMPFGGGIPAVADMNHDGIDDLVQMFYTVYAAVDGRTGQPLFPPAFLISPSYFGKWLAYSQPTVADLTGHGDLEVYLNSFSYARGGYAAVHADGKPLWAEFHNNDEGSDGLGPVGDFDADGKLEIAVPVLNGTLLCLNAADGSHKWSIKTPVTGDVIAADINGDGILELLFAGRDGRIHAVSGKDGHEIWSIAASGAPIAADVNGDGLLEVLAVGTDGVLRVIGPK